MKLKYTPQFTCMGFKHEVTGYNYYVLGKGLSDAVFRASHGNKAIVITALRKQRKEYGLSIGQINEISKLMKDKEAGIIDETGTYHKI